MLVPTYRTVEGEVPVEMFVCLLLLMSAGFVIGGNSPVPWMCMNDGRKYPALGIGTWLGFDKWGNPEQNEKMRQGLEWAIDIGYRHIDTASLYLTEEQVGLAVNKKIAQGVIKREDIFITTKLWNDKHAQDAVVPALKTSLEKLNLTYVDLYLIHWPVATYTDGISPSLSKTDYIETWLGMIETQRLGLTKSIGVSNFNADQLDRLVAKTGVKPAMNQIEINLTLQEPDLLEYCRYHDITVTGYTPFGSLFYNKAQKNAPPPRVDDPTLCAIAAKYNKSVPQLTLRYLYELGVIPIPMSVNKEHIQENLDIFDFCLTKEERDMLKRYDVNYRAEYFLLWKYSPHYPFRNEL